MHSSSSLSADGALSSLLGFLVALMTFLSVLHHTKHWRERFEHVAAIRYLYDYSGVAQKRLIYTIVRLYEFRFVSLWLLLAMIVATVSPVSALMEIETSVVAKACGNLSQRGLLNDGASHSHCVKAASTDGFTFVEMAFGETKSHFLQVALWPLMAVVYGFALYLFLVIFRSRPDQSIEEVVEELPHAYHALGMLLFAFFAGVGKIQDLIGT